MKTFLVLLLLAYARSEKLDLTYLPPPGSEHAGGRPEDIEVPLEFPKETYTTTLRPQDFDGGITNPEDYQATIGINRGLPTGSLDTGDMTSGPKAPYSYFQNTYKVPTTTVSYAFTQTTTHPPTEGFETTIGPQYAGTGLPYQDAYDKFQPQEPSLTYQENFNQPGYKQNHFEVQKPTVGSIAQYPEYPNQPQMPFIDGNQQSYSRPGYQQSIDPFSGQRPISPFSRPISQFNIPGSVPQIEGSETFEKEFQTYNKLGQKNFYPAGSESQFVVQNPTIAPISGSANKFPTTPNQNLGIIEENMNKIQLNTPNLVKPGYQRPMSGVLSRLPYGQSQYQNQTFNKGDLVNDIGSIPSSISPQQLFSTDLPSTANGDRINNIQGSSTPNLSTSKTSYPGQVGVNQLTNNKQAFQQQPGLQFDEDSTFDGNRQNIFQPSSTVVPSTFTTGAQDRQPSIGNSVIPGSSLYSTPSYPESQYNNQNSKEASINRQRPERPQADTDRNAVILNYENVITPEGFAYSFDTSNGIHADESGTATDGVKAKGSYSYIGDDGKVYSVVYTADENGYQPHGDHLPTSPPIPEAIQKIIEKVKKEQEAGIYHDGSYDDDKYGHKKYQGAVRQRPQNTNKMFANGAEIPEEYVIESDSQNMKPRRPLIGIGKPKISTGELSDFDKGIQESSQYGDNEYDNDGDKIFDHNSTQRPTDRGNFANTEENDGYIQNGDVQSQYIKTTSKQPVKKVMQNIKAPNRDNVDDRRRLGNKVPSQIIEDQEYESEEPYYEDNNDSTRIINNGVSRRPLNKQNPQFGQKDVTLTDVVESNTNQKRPLTPGTISRPVINVPEQAFDEYKTTQPSDKFSDRRPTNRPILGNIQDQSNEKYKLQKGRLPFPKPQYSIEDDIHRVTDENESEENVTKLPSRIQPNGNQPSLGSTYRDQTMSTRRRPDFITEASGAQNVDVNYQPDDGEKQIGSGEIKNISPQNYVGLVKGKPVKVFDGKYEEEEQISSEYIPERGQSNRPQFASEKYGVTRKIPQISGSLNKSQTSIEDNSGQMVIGDQKFGQKLTRPNIYQQIDNNSYNQQPINETGYQYIPPLRKFEQKGTPVMYTENTRVSFSRKPPTQKEVYNKDNVQSKPFMTPNVYRGNAGLTFDEYDQDEDTLAVKPGNKQNQQNQFNTENYQNPDRETTPDQIFSDEIISSPSPPSKIRYTSSTYGPSSSTGKPLIPQYTDYNQYTQNVPTVNNGVQNENRRPNQDTDRTNRYKYTKVPYGTVSSTSPLPSNRSYYESTNRSPTPAEKNNYNTGTYQYPGQKMISSNTQITSPKPNFEDFYQQNTNGPQYQSTLRPGEIRPTTEYTDGTTVQRFPTVSSTYSTSNVGPSQNTQYDRDLPSTTYRPIFTINKENESPTTAVPGIVVDGFGRPITSAFGSTVRDGTPSSTADRQPIRNQSTKGNTPSRFKGQQRYRPNTKSGVTQQVIPTFQSTTPNVVGEDFSGPKQQQKFDPKFGYYYK